MKKRKRNTKRARPRSRSPAVRKAPRSQQQRLRYAAVNPGVSTLMLVNPPHQGQGALGRGMAAIGRRLKSLEERLRKGRRRMKRNPKKKAAHVAQAVREGVAQHLAKVQAAAAKPRKRRRSRAAPPRPRAQARPHDRKWSSRGLPSLTRARSTVHWERKYARPLAREYLDKHKFAVNPGELSMPKQTAGAVAGFLVSRVAGNLLGKLPISFLTTAGPLAGPILAGIAGYFATGGKHRAWRGPILTGAGMALLDAIVRRLLPASIQGYLGDGDPYAVGYIDDGTGQVYLPDGTGDFQVRPAMAGDGVGDFQVRPAMAGDGGDFQVRPATAGVDETSAYVPTGGYETPPGASGYEQASGEMGNYLPYSLGAAPPFMANFLPPHVAQPHVSYPRLRPLRVIVDCPRPPAWQRYPAFAQKALALPPNTTFALPPHMTMALPPASPVSARPVMPAPAQPARGTLAGGIFGDDHD